MARARKLPDHFQAAVDQALAAERTDSRPRADRLTLVLPFPPSTNNLYRSFVVNGRAHRAKTSEAKKYSEMVVNRIKAWALEHDQRPPAPPYRLILKAWPPADKRAHDLSNTFKCVEDAVFEAIGGNDNDVRVIYAEKFEPVDQPCIELTLATRREG